MVAKSSPSHQDKCNGISTQQLTHFRDIHIHKTASDSYSEMHSFKGCAAMFFQEMQLLWKPSHSCKLSKYVTLTGKLKTNIYIFINTRYEATGLAVFLPLHRIPPLKKTRIYRGVCTPGHVRVVKYAVAATIHLQIKLQPIYCHTFCNFS